MCGIIGKVNSIAAPVIKSEEKIISEMLYAGALRGFDSTGYFMGHPNKEEIILYKRALSSPDFLRTRKYQKDLSLISRNPFFIGHNRAATKGAVDDESSHPFVHGNITLVHNGTLISNPDGTHHFDIDSEAICYKINQCNGDLKSIKDLLENLSGAFTLIWWDSAQKKLFMTRNWERPLHLFFLESGTIFLCSEKKMGEWVLDRNHVKVSSSQELPEDELWILEIGRQSISIGKEAYEPNIWQSFYGSRTGNSIHYKHYATDYKDYSRVWPKEELKMLKEVGYDPETLLEFKLEYFQPYSLLANTKEVNDNSTMGHCFTNGKLKLNGKDIKYRLCLRNKTRGFFNSNQDSKKFIGIPYSIYKDKEFNGNYTITVELRSVLEDTDKKNQKKLLSTDSAIPGQYFINGKYRKKQDVMECLKGGCVYCGVPLAIEDLDDIVWYADDTPLCSTCDGEFKESVAERA